MMETKFTKGEWTVKTLGCDNAFSPPKKKFIVDSDLWKSVAIIAIQFDKYDTESEANAMLIAAAPDLYKELHHLVRILEPLEKEGSLDVPGLATLNGARKALKKATE